MDITEKMKQDWNRRALRNARFWVDTEHFQNDAVFEQAGARDVDKFLALLNDYRQPAWNILEIGCGIGRMIKPMALFFAYVTGVDVSAEMIAQGRERLKDLPNVQLLENNGLDLKVFGPDQFDFVYSCIAFQHMPEEIFDRYLAEIHRVLRPGGFLEFQIFTGSHREVNFEDTLTVRVYEENELLDKLRLYGFILKNKYAEPSKPGGPQSRILLVQKNDKGKTTAEIPLFDRECEPAPSALEDQLTLQLVKNYIANGDTPEAEKLLHQLIENNPAHLEAWFELAILQLDKGRAPESIETLEKMLEKNPVFYSGYYSLLELYQKTGQNEKTTGLLNRLREQQAELSRTLSAVEKLLSTTKKNS